MATENNLKPKFKIGDKVRTKFSKGEGTVMEIVGFVNAPFDLKNPLKYLCQVIDSDGKKNQTPFSESSLDLVSPEE